MKAIRLAKKHKRMNEKELLILDKKMSDLEEENATELVDYLVARLGKHRGIEEDILLYEILSQLSSQQRMVITKVVLEGHSEREVAQQLGISKQAVNRIKQRAVRRLRDELYPEVE
ncbi:DNA-directed RNA polymerase specialized sigma subunit, sigma24 homolog [[Clostridium] ultunense Esp]|nr:DNA-directed RNA polymerase specialized sigma subunit, sigma24 homolog [[Clostridium] ultunense Esp]